MCTGVELALAGAAAAGTAATVVTAEQQRKAGKAQRDSLLRAEAERKAAEDRAAQNAAIAVGATRQRQRQQSLLSQAAGADRSGGSISTLQAYGKQALGQ